MATQEKPPPRRWEIDDLLDLGKKGGVTYLKAVPVLILEEWGRQGQGAKVYVRTKALERRLVDSGLHRPFPPKGTSNIFGALGSIQKDRNLTSPPLMKSKTRGGYWVNLEDYKDLLEEFRQIYRKRYPEDYKKLFSKGEPEWGLPSLREGSSRTEATHRESKVQEEIQKLLAPVEQALRDRQQAVERLTEENQKLQAELVALQTALQEGRQVPHRRIVDEELRNDCAELLENNKYYIDAIRRASVVLEERLKKAVEGTGAEKLQYGASLVRYALAKDTGKLVISDISNEQDGVFELFSGAFAFVRNPPAHKKVQYTELEAWQTISLIDYLLLLLRQAKPRET